MATFRLEAARVLRYPAWDALFIALSGAHGAVLALGPAAPIVAILLWWNANTISHNFIHRPFFRRRAANRMYSAYLTLVLGFPQTLWRERHLRHHGEIGGAKPAPPYVRPIGGAKPAPAYVRTVVGRSGLSTGVLLEVALLAGVWTLLATQATPWFLTAYLPGWAIGLGLCHLQGHYEHARGTRSHYGRIYNFLFFNDGLHVEHHQRPGAHWTELTTHVAAESPRSRWPPVLRWLEAFSLHGKPLDLTWYSRGFLRRRSRLPRQVKCFPVLEGLERLVLRSPFLQRFVLAAHERAFRALLPLAGEPRRVTIVGGGLFPRTALVLQRLLPDAELTVVDACAEHIAIARPMLGEGVHFVHRAFDPGAPADADLVVIPLSFTGDRRRLYERPPAPAVLVHDWIVAVRRPSAVVSWLLLKRLNLLRRP